tara:strand:+ start:3231 stop:3548 length:318 start_codon:yes stop_codon:yes gene_type:complete
VIKKDISAYTRLKKKIFNMNAEEIGRWEKFIIPNSDIIVARRMIKKSEDVAAVVFGKKKEWRWMLLDDSHEVASGKAKNLQMGKFMADLKLSDITDSNLINKIFA